MLKSSAIHISAFRGFFEHLAVGGVQISDDGRFLQVNDRFCQLTGYSRDELLTMRVGDLDHPGDRPTDEQRWATFLSDPAVGYDVEKRYLRRDGETIWVHVTAARIGEDDDVTIAKTVEDITPRVVASQALREREDRLREALAAKEEFLGLVSHELRTPLTVIVGLADVMARNGMSRDKMQETVLDIRESAEHLASLLESMLVLARASGQEEDVAVEPIMVDRVAARTLERHREIFPRREVELDIRTAATLVEGNESWVAQVISNLLANAEKYSPPETRIDVVVDHADRKVIVRVLDVGPGIDPGDLPLVFEPFYRAARAQAQSGGLGLGLAVCKRLIELQGGEVWARSRDQGGAEFGFSLPAIAADPEDVSA